MVATGDAAIADKIRMMRSHGMTSLTLDRHKGHSYSYDVVELGYNYRIDEIRAAIGLAQLENLDENNRKRRALDRLYRDLLGDVPGLGLPFGDQKNISSHHIFPVILPDRVDRHAFMDKMRKQKGIQTSIHYPPVHRFEIYKQIGRQDPADLKHTDLIGAREVTLPLYPTLSEDDVRYIVSSLKQIISE
jgi:dTDP-4-amino-4,6-dideoxygalactose transaminase